MGGNTKAGGCWLRRHVLPLREGAVLRCKLLHSHRFHKCTPTAARRHTAGCTTRTSATATASRLTHKVVIKA